MNGNHSHIPYQTLGEADQHAGRCQLGLYGRVQEPLPLDTVDYNPANDSCCLHQGMNHYVMMIPLLNYAVHSFVFPECLQLHHEIRQDSLAESGEDLTSLVNTVVNHLQ
ncbi:hypothetical protein EUGRSUZ_F00793 [Eucalyptus grandis]|uniref:Uncharacterized protein n=2 Tax=Eucalyptus grandis TaxID=71139 RepID=A0ACC3KC34_EUCGR|nr:hypothetical protein EUGRSUZ_F00793 [Eucalyptus grandis]